MLLVFVIGQRAPGQKTVNLILAGIMVSSLFSAGTSYIKLVADPGSKLPEITYWLMGSLSGTRGVDIRFAILPMALGLIPLLLIRWRLNLLTLGEEEARALGINTALLRLIVVVCATLVTAASVSVSGLIGWVGLVIPHLCRKLCGQQLHASCCPASMLFGATFLLLVDNISPQPAGGGNPHRYSDRLHRARPSLLYLMHAEGRRPYELPCQVEAKGLRFSYGTHEVLHGVDFAAQKGAAGRGAGTQRRAEKAPCSAACWGCTTATRAASPVEGRECKKHAAAGNRRPRWPISRRPIPLPSTILCWRWY